MDVHVPEPGNQKLALAVDEERIDALRLRAFFRPDDRQDAMPVHDDRTMRERRPALHVDDRDVIDQK